MRPLKLRLPPMIATKSSPPPIDTKIIVTGATGWKNIGSPFVDSS
jgi:hypothetical protein